MINFEVDLREIFDCIPKDFMLTDEEQKQEAFLEDKLAIVEETKDFPKDLKTLCADIKKGQLTSELSITSYDLLAIALQNKKIARFCQRQELSDYWSRYLLNKPILSDDPTFRYKLVDRYTPFIQCVAAKLTNYCLKQAQNKKEDSSVAKIYLAKIANLGGFACELLLVFHVLTELICSKYEWNTWDQKKFLKENTSLANRIFKMPDLHGIPGCLLASIVCCYLGYYLGPEEFYYKLANFYSTLAQDEALIQKSLAPIHNASWGGSTIELAQELKAHTDTLTQVEHSIWFIRGLKKQEELAEDEKQDPPAIKNAASYSLTPEEFKKYQAEYTTPAP